MFWPKKPCPQLYSTCVYVSRQRYQSLLERIPCRLKALHTEVVAQRALDRQLAEEIHRVKTSMQQLSMYVDLGQAFMGTIKLVLVHYVCSWICIVSTERCLSSETMMRLFSIRQNVLTSSWPISSNRLSPAQSQSLILHSEQHVLKTFPLT